MAAGARQPAADRSRCRHERSWSTFRASVVPRGDLFEVHEHARARRAPDCEVVAEVAAEAAEGFADVAIERELHRPAPVGVAAEHATPGLPGRVACAGGENRRAGAWRLTVQRKELWP